MIRDQVTSIYVDSAQVKPRRRLKRINFQIRRFFCLGKATSKPLQDDESGKTDKFIKVESDAAPPKVNILVAYLNWSFETSFWKYLASALVFYLLLIAIFALLIILSVLVGVNEATPQDDSTCFENLIAGKDFDNLYSSAFTLSWTTFSTVGYGQIYPKLEAGCILANLFAAITSFFGVLYAGFVGAIVFGKVQTVYSRANVIFSDICVIRYGPGIMDDTEDLNDEIEEEEETEEPRPEIRQSILKGATKKTLPCPVLLFRIANKQSNYPRFGHIVNLTLDVVSVVERRAAHDDSRMRRQFRNLQIMPQSVPLFDRMLYVRHVLNADSPLITIETRKMIQRNHGRWSSTYDSYQKIRDTLHFSQINVSLQGVSDTSKSTVYAQTNYDFEEVMVGYKFLDMTFQDPDTKNYFVDFSLINCLTEQVGGGCEPLKVQNEEPE